MKRGILFSALTFGALLLALPDISGGRPNVNGQSTQSIPLQAESSRQLKEEEKPVFDIKGKRIRADERHIAQRTLQNGRIIAYRKNKREIAALVKALREDGVTDKELLDPNTWMMIICDRSISSGCQGGCSPTQVCAHTTIQMSDKRTTQGKGNYTAVLFGYCRCHG
ncbi:MAG TPA: hypothetical protein VF723_14450 [Pyrinomonadaceae bacterium]|jgi:hypothetical protein